jgi:hypothetical protein
VDSKEIRLECLKLAQPRDIANPDIEQILERAKRYEAFVSGDGHADKAPSQQPQQAPQKPGHSGQGQSRHQR